MSCVALCEFVMVQKPGGMVCFLRTIHLDTLLMWMCFKKSKGVGCPESQPSRRQGQKEFWLPPDPRLLIFVTRPCS